MESRKLIKFGNSSHVISLPTTWLKKNNLNKGNSIYIKEEEGNLIISSEVKEKKQESTSITITCDNKEVEVLQREIVSAYLNRFNTINITGRNIGEKSKEIIKLINNLAALEVIEQTSDKIIAKDFLKLEEISIQEIIRKIDISIRSMIEDLKLTVDEKNYKSIVNKDFNINKLCFLLFKVIRSIAKEQHLIKLFKLSSMDVFHYWILTTNLEHIADEVKRSARYLSKIKLDKKNDESIKKIISNLEGSYLDVMKAYYNQDVDLAYEVSSRKLTIVNECKDFLKNNQNSMAASLVERLKSMSGGIKNVCRVVYDK